MISRKYQKISFRTSKKVSFSFASRRKKKLLSEQYCWLNCYYFVIYYLYLPSILFQMTLSGLRIINIKNINIIGYKMAKQTR